MTRSRSYRKDHSYRKLSRSMGKALHDFDMIKEGDRILVGLSGGKDSLTLLFMLEDLKRRAPIEFKVFSAYIDPGFEGGSFDEIKEYCDEMDFHLVTERTDYGLVAHSEINRENPCFLCSRLRRKRLFEIADDLSCRVIALGHNKDDLIETLFINIFYSGEISTMLPKQSFFSGSFSIIRPLALTEAKTIRWFAGRMGFPEFVNPCPSSGSTKRGEIRRMLDGLYRSNPKIKGNIFRAMKNIKTDYLLIP